jgi:mRNA-degrading endonuclease RelE of RelBE toxin-antitoxin system
VSSAPYDVEFAETAAKIYSALHQRMVDDEMRGQTSGSNHTVFRMIEEAIKVTIPRDPLNKKYGLSGPLSRFFRIKKGRHRICWAASSQKRKVCILFISETLRKEGDANDPYNIFTKLVMSGKYDGILSDLGLHAPIIGGSVGAPPVN